MYGGLMWSMRLSIAGVMAASIFAVGWLSYAAGKRNGMQEVQQAWDQSRAAIAEAHAAEMMRARQQESALRALADRLRQERINETKRLAREYAADIERLRDRPETRAGAGGVPEGAAAGVGCTGAGLARLDAQLLAGYAHNAARLQSAYDECKAKYDALTGD